MRRAVIIAEIGECFNGEVSVARGLIDAAKAAGCDYVKFQTLDHETIKEDDPERDWFLKIALTRERIAELIGYAEERGINILFTPENVKTAMWLVEAGLREVKIASSSIANGALIGFAAKNFRKVFLSTGMASLDEVTGAVRALAGVELYLMHCISEYPTGPLLEKRGLKALGTDCVRLSMMLILKALFPDAHVGYSDHTQGILAPVAAVAAGAEVIEKHITYDRAAPLENILSGGEYLGTDHVLSLEPGELTEMVGMIREVERMFGEWKWERTEGEGILRDFLRKRFEGC